MVELRFQQHPAGEPDHLLLRELSFKAALVEQGALALLLELLVAHLLLEPLAAVVVVA